jgi:glycosyltransferase involved in cell wall biosynthesis
MGDIWEDWILPGSARRRSVDILHGPAFLIPTRRTRVAKVVTIHDLVAFGHPETLPWKYMVYMRHLIRRAARKATRVITDSESVRIDIRKRLGTPAGKLDIIPLGVRQHLEPCPPEQIARVRDRFGLTAPYLLFVGNLEPRKNLPGLVRAFRRVRAAVPDIQLVVAGKVAWKSGPLQRDLDAEDLRGLVHTTGYVEAEDLQALYSGAEVFVFPSFWEGFGLPVLEAMACGTPVVASNVSSIPEVAGDAALLVDPTRPEEIADALVRLLRDSQLRADLVGRGSARAREFPWSRTAEATLDVYRQAISDRRGAS